MKKAKNVFHCLENRYLNLTEGSLANTRIHGTRISPTRPVFKIYVNVLTRVKRYGHGWVGR